MSIRTVTITQIIDDDDDDDGDDPVHAAVTSFPSAAFAFAFAIVPASTPSQNSIHAGKTVSFQSILFVACALTRTHDGIINFYPLSFEVCYEQPQ